MAKAFLRLGTAIKLDAFGTGMAYQAAAEVGSWRDLGNMVHPRFGFVGGDDARDGRDGRFAVQPCRS